MIGLLVGTVPADCVKNNFRRSRTFAVAEDGSGKALAIKRVGQIIHPE